MLAVEQQPRDRCTYWLARCLLVESKTGGRIGFKAVELAGGCTAQIDSGYRQSQRDSKATTPGGEIIGNIVASHVRGRPIARRVTIVVSIGKNFAPEDFISYNMDANIGAIDVLLELRWAMRNVGQSFAMLGAKLANDAANP